MTAAEIAAVDVGNSSVKLGVFPQPLPQQGQPFKALLQVRIDLGMPIPLAPNAQRRWVIGSVSDKNLRQIRERIESIFPGEEINILTAGDLAIEVDLAQPERVGIDRLAAAVGANLLRPEGQPTIIVDAGTAVTVDAVSADGRFLGGVILPGLGVMADSLAEAAEKLPKLKIDLTAQLAAEVAIGKTTEEAMQIGVVASLSGGVRTAVENIWDSLVPADGAKTSASKKESDGITIFATGGDAELLVPRLFPNAVVRSDLVLVGLAASLRPA